MNKFTLVGALALMAAISPFGRAQVNQNGGNGPGDFTIERILTLSSASAPMALSFPPPVLAALQKGALELHQIFVYTSATRTLEQSAIVVPGNSPLPFPNAGSAPVGDHYIVQVDSASTTSSPSPSAVLVGHVISNDVPTPFGTITGAIITLSFGFQGSGPATRFGPIYESVSPLYGLYTPTGVGSLSLTPTPQACSAATLNGVYMFTLQGLIQTGPTSFAPYAESGRFFVDGQGSGTVIDAGSLAGNIFTDRTFPLTYALDSLCSGTFKFPGGSIYMVASKDGQRVNMAFTSPSSWAVNGSAQLQ